MTKDFTLAAWDGLVAALTGAGYASFTHADLAVGNLGTAPHVLFRHDVDRMSSRAAAMAEVEAARGVRATYYFRIVPQSFDRGVIDAVHAGGHEIGYHYENLADTGGDVAAAWDDFRRNLARFEPWGGVKTIAMHGRPFSRWDNRDLWARFDYRELGVLLEPYRDIDWTRYRYFTDTGRRWDDRFNRRDRVGQVMPDKPATTAALTARLVADPAPTIVSAHPERWPAGAVGWATSWAIDQATNLAKRALEAVRPSA